MNEYSTPLTAHSIALIAKELKISEAIDYFENIKFENNNKDGKELFYIFFVELKTFIIFNSKERMLEAISKFSQELKEDSNLNIQNIVECDNGIEVEFFTCVKSIKFEEKPNALK